MTNQIPVKNPRTGEVDYHITPPSAAELSAECARLKENQKEWASAPLEHRIGVLRQWAEVVAEHRDAIAAAECLDTGRKRMSNEAVDGLIGGVEGWCQRAPDILKDEGEHTSSVMPHVRFRNQYKAYPLLGVISPWNFPMMLSLIDATPALLAGSAAIIKPSEVTPRFVEPLMKTIQAVPELAGVLSYVVGDGETGQQIVDEADIVCFTGSVPTGRKVAEQCARNFIPAFLELGGKDPVIVTKNADLDRAATSVLRGATYATGQICFSIERVYVDETVHDEFVAKLVERAEAVDISYPDIDHGDIGPMIFERQGDIINAQLEDALSKGAELRTGGKAEKLGGGTWMRPTVLTNVSHDMDIMVDETFGPVIPVMAFSSDDEAVTLANDTSFGLSGAVIGGSIEEALPLAEQIDAGAISVQDTTLTGAILRDAEKTSFNLSGMGGSRMGPASIKRFLRKKALLMNTADSVVDLKVTGETAANHAAE